MNRLDKIRLAYGSTLMDDGYTLWNDGKTREKGFVVGGVNLTASDRVCERDDTDLFGKLFVEHLGLLEVDLAMNFGVGTWVYQGQIHFDIVQLCNTEDEAHTTCKMRDEKAYYDIANKKSVYI